MRTHLGMAGRDALGKVAGNANQIEHFLCESPDSFPIAENPWAAQVDRCRLLRRLWGRQMADGGPVGSRWQFLRR